MAKKQQGPKPRGDRPGRKLTRRRPVTAKEPRGPGVRVFTPELVQKLADYWCQGYEYCELATIFGVSYDTIARQLKKVHEIWRERLTDGVELELAKIGYLERVAWEEWHASKKPEVQTTQEYETVEQQQKAIEGQLADAKVGKKLVKEAVKKVTRTGNTAYLEIVKWCIQQRCKLLGHGKGHDVNTLPVIIQEVIVESPEQARKAIEFQDFESQFGSPN